MADSRRSTADNGHRLQYTTEMLQKSLFSLARSPIGHFFIGWIFTHMSFAIPVNRLRETDTLLAFYHPRPSYSVHILLVPKKAIRSLSDLKPKDDFFLAEVFRISQELIKELDLTKPGYRLIVNGGEFQDVPQLHFHLISGDQRPGTSDQFIISSWSLPNPHL